jgi:hypothetical protein
MSKAVLISIQPKWCELIASGKKTVEVRRTKPKIDVPFKCYIYCTKGDWLTSVNGKVQNPNNMVIDLSSDSKIEELNGKVIGEFVCNQIGTTSWINTPDHPLWRDGFCEEICLTNRELYDYSKGGIFYEWDISDLVIYDKPRELSGFFHYCGDNPKCDGCEAHYYSNTECGKEEFCCSEMYGCKHLERPPQSWCYCEEGADNEQREAD